MAAFSEKGGVVKEVGVVESGEIAKVLIRLKAIG